MVGFLSEEGYNFKLRGPPKKVEPSWISFLEVHTHIYSEMMLWLYVYIICRNHSFPLLNHIYLSIGWGRCGLPGVYDTPEWCRIKKLFAIFDPLMFLTWLWHFSSRWSFDKASHQILVPEVFFYNNKLETYTLIQWSLRKWEETRIFYLILAPGVA